MPIIPSERKRTIPRRNSPFAVAGGDFNGDGKKDLAVAGAGSGVVSILLGNGDGTFQPHVDYAAGAFPCFLAVADFNGDGKLDLVTTNAGDNTVSILLGKGDGTFSAPSSLNAGGAPPIDPNSVQAETVRIRPLHCVNCGTRLPIGLRRTQQ